MLWESREEIVGALLEVFISFSATGEVLEDWWIILCLNVRRAAEIGSYKLVSLKSVVGKLLKWILRDKVCIWFRKGKES